MKTEWVSVLVNAIVVAIGLVTIATTVEHRLTRLEVQVEAVQAWLGMPRKESPTWPGR